MPGSRVLVAGGASTGSGHDFALARYNADGSPDQSFDGDGVALVDFGHDDLLRDATIQSDGKIVALGSTVGGAALARLNGDGSLDREGLDPYLDAPFGTGGKIVTDGAGDALVIAVDGKLVAAGSTTATPTGSLGFEISRHNIDGSLDSSFGTGGIVATDPTASVDLADSVVISREGKIIAAGTANIGSSTANFALARYLVRGCCSVEGSPPGSTPTTRPGPGVTPGRPVPLPPSPGA